MSEKVLSKLIFSKGNFQRRIKYTQASSTSTSTFCALQVHTSSLQLSM